jgi:hypothetical protein
MGFFSQLKKMFSPTPLSPEADAIYIFARCDKCKQIIRGRIDTRNELGRSDGGFIWRKELMGSGKNRCFNRIEVILEFDDQRKITEQRIYGGKFVTKAEYDAQMAQEAAAGSA